MGFYAIGLNKGWVEIRSADNKPVTKRSKVVRNAELPPGFYPYNSGRTTIKHKFVLESVYHEGGKVVAIVPRNRFMTLMRKLGHQTPDRGAVREMPAELGKKFTDEAWRRSNHV